VTTLVKGTNLVSCAVYFFLMCLIPFLTIPGDISYALNVIRDAKHGNIESGPYLAATRVLSVTAGSIVLIFSLLSQLLNVAHIESEHRNMARIIMINE
jgi:hypothetical protein